jgi:predicted DNA-binding protein YlxM (UPF0122 family)
MADDKLKMTMLYDFFGELLTDKQREYYDLYHNEDLSLSEIAENTGITRQGVRDIIVRAENTLAETEQKTGLIRRFIEMQGEIDKALVLITQLKAASPDESTSAIASRLEDILNGLKG